MTTLNNFTPGDNYSDVAGQFNLSFYDNGAVSANITPPGNATGATLSYKWGALSLCLIIIVSIVGNVMVCVAIAMDRKLQNMTNFFLMSLAISDLLVAALVMPLGVYNTFVGELNSYYTLVALLQYSTQVLLKFADFEAQHR